MSHVGQDLEAIESVVRITPPRVDGEGSCRQSQGGNRLAKTQ
jgi:hypothetical protein